MNFDPSQITLLYELSLANTRHYRPIDNARQFVNKLLSRKALTAGIVWLFDGFQGDSFICKILHAMPDLRSTNVIKADRVNSFFSDGLVVSDHSIFGKDIDKGRYAYFKLNDIGFLELFSDDESKLSLKSLNPLRDVVNQLAVSLEIGFSYQNLQDQIRQREKAEKSLRANEEKYRNIIDNVQLGLLEVDNDEIITYANKSFQDLVGYSLSEMLGKNASTLLIDQDDQKNQDLLRKENEKRTEGVSNSYELSIKDKHGNKKWTIISGAPNYDSKGEQIGSIGIHLDITEQKKLIEENVFKDTRIKKLFDISLDALVSIDSKGVIFEWSRQAEEIFGFTINEAIGKTLSETIIPVQHREGHEKGMQHYLSTGEGPVLNKRIEITAVRKSGEEFPIELTIFPLKFGEKHFFTAFVRDITEIKESRENMEKALNRQKELNELKSKFISMISHELRTPLTTIRSNTEIANYLLEQEHTPDKDKLARNISRIENNVERLNQLISNILMIGKLDAGKVPFNPKKQNIFSLIKQEVLPNLSAQPKLNDINDQLESEVDTKLFTHVMNNLIENAFKYSPNGKTPEVDLKDGGDTVLIKIRDYGIGIPTEDHDRIFDTFFRASNVDNIQGTGLGLSIVKDYVELHGGKITLTSDVGKGTVFSIFLPK
ncbi:MAG: PAS domain-containing sensor histidine kinase [Bacteroidota bacterium]